LFGLVFNIIKLLPDDPERPTGNGLFPRFHVPSGGAGQFGRVSNGFEHDGSPSAWNGTFQQKLKNVLIKTIEKHNQTDTLRPATPKFNLGICKRKKKCSKMVKGVYL